LAAYAIGVIIGLALGITIGVTGDVLATPPPTQNSTEARLQALESLMWTETHATSAVSQRVYDRVSTCPDPYICYQYDTVLAAFTAIKDEQGRPQTVDIIQFWARSAIDHRYGTWYARDNGDGDSFTVWVDIRVGGSQARAVWTVWQSNGYIRGVY
jgi:hypothetical protein